MYISTCLLYSTLSSPLFLLQNVVVTYAGMLFGDYIFDAYNFVGINVRCALDSYTRVIRCGKYYRNGQFFSMYRSIMINVIVCNHNIAAWYMYVSCSSCLLCGFSTGHSLNALSIHGHTTW